MTDHFPMFPIDRLAVATDAVFEAVERAAQHDDRLTECTPNELLAAMIAAAGRRTGPHSLVPLAAEFYFAYAASRLATSEPELLAALLRHIALALHEAQGR